MSSSPSPAHHHRKSASAPTGQARIRTPPARTGGTRPAAAPMEASPMAAPQAIAIPSAVVFSMVPQIVSTTSTTRRKISREEKEHMITYGAPGALNISAFAA